VSAVLKPEHRLAGPPARRPSRERSPAAPEGQREQALFGGEAVIVEGVDPVGDVDVVAAESGCRFDPSGAEFEIRIAFQKREGQHLTGAVSEEVPVGPVPPPDRIGLHVDLREEHSGARALDDSVS
jgi:hypothetical protein